LKAGDDVAKAITGYYGADRTFAVPILMNCALAGIVPWAHVPPLPYELAVVPSRFYRLFNLRVVSYALPALIAVGLVIDARAGRRNPLRKAVVAPVLRKLAGLQPNHGGFLDAIPLTSFVGMSLAAVPHLSASPVLGKCLDYIRRSVRHDGSWPIDADLSTWVTSSALNALHCTQVGRRTNWESTLAWLRERQTTAVHPFTGAAAGGWPWTFREGGVPDADDTAGAVIALSAIEGARPATTAGACWLFGLQNGGWPTFCRGWGHLPFDRSSPDVTAHAIRALRTVRVPGTERACAKGLRYLAAAQRPDGSWVPLWFGSQLTPDHANPVLGTSRTLLAFTASDAGEPFERGVAFLLGARQTDGAFGADRNVAPTVEETALAVTALCHALEVHPEREDVRAARDAGAESLAARVLAGDAGRPAPLGLYFAGLWYSEQLYPLIWAVEALGRTVEMGKQGQ
jgi:squalene-hopene/tetraprenyl-beta-curcumene cyclase